MSYVEKLQELGFAVDNVPGKGDKDIYEQLMAETEKAFAATPAMDALVEQRQMVRECACSMLFPLVETWIERVKAMPLSDRDKRVAMYLSLGEFSGFHQMLMNVLFECLVSESAMYMMTVDDPEERERLIRLVVNSAARAGNDDVSEQTISDELEELKNEQSKAN